MIFTLLSWLGLVPTFQKTKCKKLLRTTMERIKLLQSRREAQQRQLRIDVAKLLQLGKDEKAQVWIGRICKELCLLSAYRKISAYCQSVQVNIKDIAGQDECPTNLEEPIAGLCFAASCCADLPELQEFREMFAMKYGKKFVASAQNLEPDCHVNREFLECLYAKDPPDHLKQELLQEIVAQYKLKQSNEHTVQKHEQDIQATPLPPPPPPNRIPPLPPLRSNSMPSSRQIQHENDQSEAPLPFRFSSTMTKKLHNQSFDWDHVHPRLPKYEDLVANFTALKH